MLRAGFGDEVVVFACDSLVRRCTIFQKQTSGPPRDSHVLCNLFIINTITLCIRLDLVIAKSSEHHLVYLFVNRQSCCFSSQTHALLYTCFSDFANYQLQQSHIRKLIVSKHQVPARYSVHPIRPQLGMSRFLKPSLSNQK